MIKKNAGASLIDIGDGVACLEFHSKMNAIGGDTLQMLKFALGEVEKNFVGLVVGNQGANFCVGANIMLMLMEAQEENWEELDMMARVFQNSTMSLRYSPKPVVVAPFQMVFGGGCEMVLHGDRVQGSSGDIHRVGRSWCRNYSGGWRHERDADARARLDPERC